MENDCLMSLSVILQLYLQYFYWLEEIAVPRVNHQLSVRFWKTWSFMFVLNIPCLGLELNLKTLIVIDTVCKFGRCKFNCYIWSDQLWKPLFRYWHVKARLMKIQLLLWCKGHFLHMSKLLLLLGKIRQIFNGCLQFFQL